MSPLYHCRLFATLTSRRPPSGEGPSNGQDPGCGPADGHETPECRRKHDPVHGYLPQGWSVAEWRAKQESDPKTVEKAARASMRVQVQAMVDFWNAGVPTLDYGNNIRQVAKDEGLEDAFAFPGFVPAYIRPLFCKGIGPFRWCALSGDPEDIYKTDAKMKELFPDNAHLHQWLDMAQERIAFQGLPARICWIGLGDRHRAGLAFNEMVRNGELKAPVVIGRDHQIKSS